MGKYKLYGTVMTGTCSIHAALEELGVPYGLVEITTSEGHQNTEEYRKINPRQQVPSLMLPDGQVVTEGPAILMHLADAHPEANLAPACGTAERSQINRWLFFFSANVYEGELRKLVGHLYTTNPNGGEAVRCRPVRMNMLIGTTRYLRRYSVMDRIFWVITSPYWIFMYGCLPNGRIWAGLKPIARKSYGWRIR